MSGPKVVRVVTREELVAQCEGALARLDCCAQLWRTELAAMGRLTDEHEQAMVQRREELKAALANDRFADVLRQAAAEVGFLEVDVDEQREKHVQAKAREAGRRTSARFTALEVARALKARGGSYDALLNELADVGSGRRSAEEADNVLSRAFAAMSPLVATGLSESQRALAQRLVAGESDLSLQAWKTQRAQQEERLAPIFQLLGQVQALNGRRSAEFEGRLSDVLAMDDGPRRKLLIDSVMLDLTAERAACQRLVRLRREAELLSAEVDAVGGESSALRLAAQVNEASEAESLEAAIAAAQAALDASRRRRAADARRAAVLQGLSSLGYTVTEGMATALAEGGRLVVKKPDMAGYGVEVADGAEAERLQVRAVALSKVRDTTKDHDAETAWCSDFSHLREALAAVGTDVVVEKALPVGKVPLRVVEEADVVEEQRRSPAPGLLRSLPDGR
jgi:hypothetical protein